MNCIVVSHSVSSMAMVAAAVAVVPIVVVVVVVEVNVAVVAIDATVAAIAAAVVEAATLQKASCGVFGFPVVVEIGVVVTSNILHKVFISVSVVIFTK